MAYLKITKIGARLIAVVGVLSMLAACSSLKFAYSFVDNTLASRAERYLALDAADAAKVDGEVAALIAWHRAEMLPRYAAFLMQTAALNDAGTWQKQDVAVTFAHFRTLLNDTARGAAPFIANVLADHTSTAKVDHLRTKMADYIREEFEEEDATAEARLSARVDRRVSNFERFVGPLRDDQIDIVRRHTAPTLDDRQRWLHHLNMRQNALADYLQTDPQHDGLRTFVYTLVMRGYDIVDPGYAVISEQRWAKLTALYEDVLASLDAAQRVELSSSLRSYAEDMIDLAAAS